MLLTLYMALPGAACSFAMTFFTLPSAVSAQTPQSFEYRATQGQTITLYPYTGQKIALLVPSPNLDNATLSQIVTVFDAAYDYYAQATGRDPGLFFNYNGLATIAVVPLTCGVGCGFLGFTGIELQNEWFDILYNGVRNQNEYDQVVFYEFGRNFWFYGDKIEYKDSDNAGSVTTGYAVFMRFMAMEATGVTPGLNGNDFAVFKAEVQGLLDLYLADKSLDWNNTLRVGRAPTNLLGLGGADLFASFLFKLREYYGDNFVQQIWKEVAKRPDTQTTQDAVDNFVLAASAATDKNLTSLFANTWRWPVSNAAIQEAASRFGSPISVYEVGFNGTVTQTVNVDPRIQVAVEIIPQPRSVPECLEIEGIKMCPATRPCYMRDPRNC